MQGRHYVYLSPAFCTSTPIIHWSYTIRCHISFTVRADIDTDRTVSLVSFLAAIQGPKNRTDLKIEVLFYNTLLYGQLCERARYIKSCDVIGYLSE